MSADIINLFLSFKSPHTRRAYRAVITQFKEFLKDKPLTEAKISDVLEYLSSISDKSPATLRHRYNALKAFYEYLVQVEACSKNPVKGCRAAIGARRGGQVRPTKLIAPELILGLLTLPDARDRAGVRDVAILHLLAGAGLRRSEAVGLNIDDIAVTAKGTPFIRLKHTKAGKVQERTLPIWAYSAVSELVSQRKRDGAAGADPLLVNYRGYGKVVGRISDSTLARTVKAYLKMAGIDAACHSLRASFASALLEQGCDSWDVARALGHSSTRMVNSYDKRLHSPDNSPIKKFKYEP